MTGREMANAYIRSVWRKMHRQVSHVLRYCRACRSREPWPPVSELFPHRATPRNCANCWVAGAFKQRNGL